VWRYQSSQIRLASCPLESLGPLAFAQAHPRTAAVLVDELYARLLKCEFEHRNRRLTRLRSFTLKQPNRRYSYTGGIREFLLRPIKKASSRSTLGWGKHVQMNTLVSDSRQFDCFSIDS